MEEKNNTETASNNSPESGVSPKLKPFLTPIAVVISGLIIAMAIHWGGGTTGSTDQVVDKKPPAVDITKVDISGDPYIGEQNAPVTVAYWSDFQCPFCKKFESETLNPIIKEYVDTGKVKIVFKDYQFLGPDSDTAGLYGRAIWDLYPSKYFVWREAMFARQDEEHGGFGDELSVYALTKTILGIDADKVRSQITSQKDKYEKLMADDRTEGTKFGVSGTPGFIIGKQIIPGAISYSNFKQIIEQQLK